jgi:hypothetical protein
MRKEDSLKKIAKMTIFKNIIALLITSTIKKNLIRSQKIPLARPKQIHPRPARQIFQNSTYHIPFYEKGNFLCAPLRRFLIHPYAKREIFYRSSTYLTLLRVQENLYTRRQARGFPFS